MFIKKFENCGKKMGAPKHKNRKLNAKLLLTYGGKAI